MPKVRTWASEAMPAADAWATVRKTNAITGAWENATMDVAATTACAKANVMTTAWENDTRAGIGRKNLHI